MYFHKNYKTYTFFNRIYIHLFDIGLKMARVLFVEAKENSQRT